MIQALPYGGYDYVISLDEIFTTANDSEIGYFVDEDLEYTDAIRKRHFPLRPESKSWQRFSLTLWKKCQIFIHL